VRDADAILACAEGGAGGLVAKTISRSAAVVPTPNMAEISHGFLNAERWSELPPERWLEDELPRARSAGVPLIVSLGYSADDIAWLAPRVRPFADALELSTHYIGEDPGPMVDAIKAAKDAVGVPVFVKLSPLGRELPRAAELAVRAGADAIVAINSFGPCLAIDIETGRPLLHSTYAGVGGPWMRPITLKWISKVARAVDVPISATNGVFTWEDVVKMIMVGAGTVQTCTAIMYGTKQYGVITDFLKGLNKYLDGHGYASVKDIQGITLPQILTWDAVDREHKHVSSVNKDKCNACGLCKRWCFYDAISYDKNKKAKIDPARCDGCGLCPSLCPKDAISMEGKVFLGNFK